MQKWTFANADPGFKAQGELSLQLFQPQCLTQPVYVEVPWPFYSLAPADPSTYGEWS